MKDGDKESMSLMPSLSPFGMLRVRPSCHLLGLSPIAFLFRATQLACLDPSSPQMHPVTDYANSHAKLLVAEAKKKKVSKSQGRCGS